MQHEAHLIGECRAATRAVGGKLAFVQIDSPRASMCRDRGSLRTTGRNSSMGIITVIGLDTAKSIFQVHGIDNAGK